MIETLYQSVCFWLTVKIKEACIPSCGFVKFVCKCLVSILKVSKDFGTTKYCTVDCCELISL